MVCCKSALLQTIRKHLSEQVIRNLGWGPHRIHLGAAKQTLVIGIPRGCPSSVQLPGILLHKNIIYKTGRVPKYFQNLYGGSIIPLLIVQIIQLIAITNLYPLLHPGSVIYIHKQIYSTVDLPLISGLYFIVYYWKKLIRLYIVLVLIPEKNIIWYSFLAYGIFLVLDLPNYLVFPWSIRRYPALCIPEPPFRYLRIIWTIIRTII